MQVHIFEGSGGWYGFTPQANGGNLPDQHGPWSPFKSVVMLRDHPAPRIGVNEADVLAAIERHGYYITNAKIDFGERETE